MGLIEERNSKKSDYVIQVRDNLIENLHSWRNCHRTRFFYEIKERCFFDFCGMGKPTKNMKNKTATSELYLTTHKYKTLKGIARVVFPQDLRIAQGDSKTIPFNNLHK